MNNLNKLFLSNPEAFNKVVLTPFQIGLLEFIIKHKITTSKQLTKQGKLSVATSGMQLKDLTDKGYLTRKLDKTETTSGRGEYIYAVAGDTMQPATRQQAIEWCKSNLHYWAKMVQTPSPEGWRWITKRRPYQVTEVFVLINEVDQPIREIDVVGL